MLMTVPDSQPVGLNAAVADRLHECAQLAQQVTPGSLLQSVADHLQLTREAHQNSPLVNLRLAEGIAGPLLQTLQDWATLTVDAQYWVAAAAFYFCRDADEEPDFSSPLGFEDDAEVLNACLRCIGRSHLCLNVEDYDDV